MSLSKLSNIFTEYCDYKNINNISSVKLRNHKNGIQPVDAMMYRLMYSNINVTKEEVTSKINDINKTSFTRQAYENKENNIPVTVYENILSNLREYYNCYYGNEDNFKLLAIDGTYTNDINMKDTLNLGIYNVDDGIPVDIVSYGKEGKNREISSATSYIKSNMDIFKNNIIVVDRGYFSYKFINFLIENNLKFIIRVKGEAQYLNGEKKINKSMKDYECILNAKNNARIVKYDKILRKTIYTNNKKKKNEQHTIEIKNNCILITNLSADKYPDDKLLFMYKSRWDIEVFFKYVKNNFKFQHATEINATNMKKMYICESIIIYIAKIMDAYDIEKHRKKYSNDNYTRKVNKSNMISGIFDILLPKLFNSRIYRKHIDDFCTRNIKYSYNKIDRNFPRTAKKPFSKWYNKGYSDQTKYFKTINAILNGKVDDLEKNLKTIAKRIISVNGIKYG